MFWWLYFILIKYLKHCNFFQLSNKVESHLESSSNLKNATSWIIRFLNHKLKEKTEFQIITVKFTSTWRPNEPF